MLRVQNNTQVDLNDRYNGVDFKFPAGASVALDEDAAKHIFGFGDGDKVPYLVRQGWMRSSGDFDKAMAILSGFAFSAYDIPMAGEIVHQPIQEQIDAPEEDVDAAPVVAEPAPKSKTKDQGSILDTLAGNVG